MRIEKTASVPLTSEIVVGLIEQERIPSASRIRSGVGKDAREEMMFFIPPEGTRFGDTAQGSGITEAITYIGPDGEVRGTADLQYLPIEQGILVREKIEETLRAKGIDQSSEISYAFKRIRRWVSENISI